MKTLRPFRISRFSLLVSCFALTLLLAPASRCGDSASAQPYEKVRYSSFKDGRLYTLLEADQAEAYELSAGKPRLNLRNIVVTLYDLSDEATEGLEDDGEPHKQMTIRSQRGFFLRRPSEDAIGDGMEDVVTLEGDVQVKRYYTPSNTRPKTAPPPNRLPEDVETEIYCEHAQWNRKLRKLNGDGDVRLIQEGNRIYGTGFLYLADEAEEGESDDNDPKNWGGIIFIEHNARMEIDRPLDGDAIDQTVITCRDTASYKLVEKEVQFEREVRVARSGMTIDCDILKVFLRRKEDEAPPGGEGSMPGMVKSIVATIGSRPGAVVITGHEVDDLGRNGGILYVARGGRADYNYDEGRITLTDQRTDRIPEVEFGMDRISDRVLDFTFNQDGDGDSASSVLGDAGAIALRSLQTRGGQGRVVLRPRPGSSGEAAHHTEVEYKGEMRFSGGDNLIRFTDSVFLQRGPLTIRSESLDVRLRADEAPSGAGQAGAPETARVERVVAEGNVLINAGGRQAAAHRAEYEMEDVQSGLDTLRLYGPPSHTPPHPWISDDGGNRITAPTIVMQRLSGNRARPRHLLRAYDGTVTCDFVTKAASVAERNKVVSVKCERMMEFNEAEGVAWFDGAVQATSDAPEDNYVLTSDKLIIYFTEKPDPEDPEKVVIRPRRIDATGLAILRQDTRICEADQIIRDFPTEQLDEGDIYLEGFAGDAANPPRMAVYREQEGDQVMSLFEAPRIKASAKGNLVQANGPGRLSTPDETPGSRAEIEFAGAARYESFQGGLVSEAKFRRGVVMRQPSRELVIAADEVDATFLQEDPDGGLRGDAPAAAAIERIGRLRKAEARTGVRVEHSLPNKGRRIATGDKGVVEFTNTGNVITLSVDRRLGDQRWVMARDHDGLTLWSTMIEVRESQGVTRASGPGEVQIPGDPGAEGLNKIPTRIAYGERGMLVYNELALNIRAVDNVRILQPSATSGNWQHPSLDGRCDQLDITLAEPPEEGGLGGEDALSKVLRMEAVGNVLLRVFAEPAPGQPESDWLNRPGTTFFTRGDQAVYDVPAGRIVMSALPGRQPQLLLNLVDPGSAPRRQRLRADRFVLNTNTVPRRWFFDGQLDSSTLQPGEPFDFVE